MILFSALLFAQLFGGTGDLVKYSYKEYRLKDSILIVKEEKKFLIKTENAKEEFGTLVFPYDDSTESIEVIYARTISPDGDTINVPENALNRVADPIVDSYPFLKNRRELHISFVSLKPGVIIEYCIEKTIRNFDYVEGIEYFRTTLPVEYSKLSFYFYPEAGLRVQRGNFEGYDFSENLRDSAGYKIYEFEIKGLPEIIRTRWGISLPPIHLISPYVIFTTFPAWDSLIHYLLSHYKEIESLKSEKLNFSKLEELSKSIHSPEYVDLKAQGYVPLDRIRAASLNFMTYPEKILRLISSFEGLLPAFVLRYGFDTLRTIPALATMENIILYDGSNFIYPFRNEKKIFSNPYEGHVAIVVTPELNNFTVLRMEARDFFFETLMVDISKKWISFCRHIPSYRLLRSFSRFWGAEEEEEFENVENLVSHSEFSEYGLIRDLKVSIKNQKDVKKPYIICGKVKLKSLGLQVGKYVVLKVPEMPRFDPELFINGYYLSAQDVSNREICLIIKVPKGYIVRHVPKTVSYSDDNISLKREAAVEGNRVIIKQRLSILNKYIAYDDLIKIVGEPKVVDFGKTQVVILERKL